jgi:tetratricopeptide (TPR) repeat protein
MSTGDITDERLIDSLGDRLRRARFRAGLTQQEVSSGRYSKSYLSAVERGKIKPSLPALQELAGILNVSLAYLLGEEEEPSTPPEESARREEIQQRLRQATQALNQGNAHRALEQLGATANTVPLEGTTAVERREIALLRGRALLVNPATHANRETIAALQEALQMARQQGDMQQSAQARLWLADGYLAANDLTAALTEYGISLRAFAGGAMRDPGFAVHLHRQYGVALLAAGRYMEAREEFREALSMRSELIDLRTALVAHRGLGQCAAELGDYDTAITHFEQSLSAARLADDLDEELECQHLLGQMLRQIGRFDEAREHLLAGLAHARANSMPQVTALAAELALVYLARGEVESARQSAEEACAAAEATTAGPQLRATAYLALARVTAAQGDSGAAEDAFRRAVATFEQAPQQSANRAEATALYAEFLAQQGRYAEAHQMATQAYRSVSHDVERIKLGNF